MVVRISVRTLLGLIADAILLSLRATRLPGFSWQARR
jgi:hypothetical protein